MANLSGAAPKPAKSKSQPKSKPKSKSTSKPKPAPVAKAGANPFVGIKYPAPEIVKSGKYSQTIGNWPQSGSVKMATPNDPLSPRDATGNFKLTKRTSDADMIDGALKGAGLKRAKYAIAERLDVSKEQLGTRSVVAFGAARRQGKVVRLFTMAWVDKGSDTVKYSVLEAPQDEWNSWGGLAYTGVRKPSEFTPEILASVRPLSPAQETEIFETHYTMLMMALMRGTMMAKMGTLNTMTSFNMSAATCAGVSNCSVTADGIGGYTAETK